MPAGMYEISCLYMIMGIECRYCDTSRNSDFKVTAILVVIIVFRVGCDSHGGMYFGDDITCERIWLAMTCLLGLHCL